MHFGQYLRHPSRVAGKLRWRALYAGPRRDVTVDTWNGRLTFDSRDKLIGKYLYVQHAYEQRYIEETMAVLRARAPALGGTVFDVGANLGMISIALLRHGYFDRAVAFEPAPGNLRLLEHNVTQNGLAGRITRLPVALSSEAGEMELELSDYNSGDHRLRERAAPGAWHEDQRPTVRVPVRRLDDVLAEQPSLGDGLSLIWLDIQGHEGRFLAGARATLGRGVPVASEFWPYGILRSGTSRAEYVALVGELFTHCYELGPGGPRRLPVAAVDAMFDRYAAPKAMRQLVYVREP